MQDHIQTSEAASKWDIEARPEQVEQTAGSAATAEVVELVAGIIGDLMEQARADMAQLHPTDEAEIAAIGDLGGDRYIIGGEDGLEVFGDGDDTRPYTVLPRGLDPSVARMILRYWAEGYRRGLDNGEDLLRMRFQRLLLVGA